MGNISSYLQSPSALGFAFTQCIRKRKTSYSQQLIDIDSDSDFDDEKIIYKLEKKKYRRAAIPHTSLMIIKFLYLLKDIKKNFFYQVLFFLFTSFRHIAWIIMTSSHFNFTIPLLLHNMFPQCCTSSDNSNEWDEWTYKFNNFFDISL